MSDGLPPLNESQRLDILILRHTNEVDEYDKINPDRIKADSKKLNEALSEFNATHQKESLFGCLYELMKISELHFQHVLNTTPPHSGGSNNLNTLLRRIFTIESKWYTTILSDDLDDNMRMTDEFIRLSESSIKGPIPSILFLEFFLYVCNKIVLLVEPLKKKKKKIKEEEEDEEVEEEDEEEEDEEEEDEEEEDETHKHGVLMFVGLIGKVARHADQMGILNDGVELNNIEYLTPEDRNEVKSIKNKIVELHKQNIRNPTGQLQITLSLSSAIGYLCEEIVKDYVPSAPSGHTQDDEDTSPPTGLRVRNLYTQQFLNDSSVLREMARQKGWCPYIFKKGGCYYRTVVHRGQFNHPVGYNKFNRYFFDIRTYKVVMIDPRAFSELFSFNRHKTGHATPRHTLHHHLSPAPRHVGHVHIGRRSDQSLARERHAGEHEAHSPTRRTFRDNASEGRHGRSHPYSRGGRNYHNISRRLKKQYYSIRGIHRQRKSISSTHRRSTKRTRRRTTRRRR